VSSTIIDVSHLRKTRKKEAEKLEQFLRDRVKATINTVDKEITLKPGKNGEIPKKEHLRVLLKKYLHKTELKEEFRVIAGKEENILIIKKRKIVGEAD
jgi:hypothetical protein